VAGQAFVWVHAQSETDSRLHQEAARRGAWIEFDGVGPGQVETHVQHVLGMRKAGLLSQVLVSHDAGWYHVGEPGGGAYRGYTALAEEFLPALRKAGLTDRDERQFLIENPRRALTPRPRLLGRG
jgi:predicted metal-dependent phosphotriesterase family hydrolase